MSPRFSILTSAFASIFKKINQDELIGRLDDPVYDDVQQTSPTKVTKIFPEQTRFYLRVGLTTDL